MFSKLALTPVPPRGAAFSTLGNPAFVCFDSSNPCVDSPGTRPIPGSGKGLPMGEGVGTGIGSTLGTGAAGASGAGADWNGGCGEGVIGSEGEGADCDVDRGAGVIRDGLTRGRVGANLGVDRAGVTGTGEGFMIC